MGVKGCAQVVEKDVAYGARHLDQEEGESGEAMWRRRRGCWVTEQERAVRVLLIREAHLDAAGLGCRHDCGQVRGVDVERLAVGVYPRILVADQVPGAAIERAQLGGVVWAGKVDLDAAHMVALELLAEALCVRAEAGRG